MAGFDEKAEPAKENPPFAGGFGSEKDGAETVVEGFVVPPGAEGAFAAAVGVEKENAG